MHPFNNKSKSIYTLFLSSFIFVLSTIMISCGTEKKELKNEISDLQSQLYGDESKFDDNIAGQLFGAYSAYADKFPDDTLSISFLYNAAKLSVNLNKPNQSISLFKKVYENYPDSKQSPLALFMVAVTYEGMEKHEQAVDYYNKFITEFPDHHLVDDVQFSLKHMGSSPEEIYNAIMEEQKNLAN